MGDFASASLIDIYGDRLKDAYMVSANHLEWSEGGFKVIPHPESGVLLPNDTKAILSIDADGDGRKDILAAQNDDALLLFRNNTKE